MREYNKRHPRRRSGGTQRHAEWFARNKDDPEYRKKHRAHKAVYRAIGRGTLERGPCEMADESCRGRIEAHHENYDKPLEVRWLCVHHHSFVENKLAV